MPILYALVKATNGDIDKAYENIIEGKNSCKVKHPKGSFQPRPFSRFRKFNSMSNGDISYRSNFAIEKPDNSSSDSESRKSIEIQNNRVKTPIKVHKELNEEAKDLSINSIREKVKDIKTISHDIENQRKPLTKVNYGSVSSLIHSENSFGETLPSFYVDHERYSELAHLRYQALCYQACIRQLQDKGISFNSFLSHDFRFQNGNGP